MAASVKPFFVSFATMEIFHGSVLGQRTLSLPVVPNMGDERTASVGDSCAGPDATVIFDFAGHGGAVSGISLTGEQP